MERLGKGALAGYPPSTDEFDSHLFHHLNSESWNKFIDYLEKNWDS